MPKLTRRTVLGLKTETTQGTGVTLSATDMMLVSDLKINPVPEMLERNYYRSNLSPITSIAGKRLYEISFKTSLKGSGTAGTAYAPLSALLQAAGMVETISGGVSVTYAPTSIPVSASFFGPGKSATLKGYYDDTEWVSAGALLKTLKITLEAGKFGVIDATFIGTYSEPTDLTIPSQTYNATLEPIVQSGSFTVQTYSAIVNKIDFDWGLDTIQRMDISSAFGLKGLMIANRKIVGTMDPEFPTVAAHNFMNKVMTNATGALSVVVGATGGNICTITAPALQYMDANPEDRSGLRTLNIPFKLNGSTGDDEISIVFT